LDGSFSLGPPAPGYLAFSPGQRAPFDQYPLVIGPLASGVQLRGKQVDRLIRTSERSSFKRCRWAWNFSYNQNLRISRPKPVLRFGTLCHEALAEYYVKGKKRGTHPAKAFLKVYERDVAEYGEFVIRGIDSESDEAKWEDARELGVEMLTDYVEHYRGDPDWEVIATEHPFQYPVRHPKSGRILFYYVGIVDLVMRQISTGRIFIWDHKTTDSIKRWLATLGMNEQAGAYWTFGSQYLRDEGVIHENVYNDLSGIIFNFIRRARRDDRKQNALGQYLNLDGSVSKRQPPDRWHRETTFRSDYDREQVLKRALNDYREMEMVKNGKLAVLKNPSPFTCVGCGWYDVCELHETGADYELMLKATTEEWDPYSAHELKVDEQR
jgi:hypothetical protein